MTTINDKTIDRQLVPGNNADKRKRNCHCERATQTEGRKLESYAYKRQDTDSPEQYNADEPIVDPNLTVTGNINNRNQSLSSNQIINENQHFLSEQLTEDDMKGNMKQTNQKHNNNDSTNFLSDQS